MVICLIEGEVYSVINILQINRLVLSNATKFEKITLQVQKI